MSKTSTTVADLHTRHHVTYAQGTALADPTLIADGAEVKRLAATTATTSTFISELRAIIGVDATPQTWSHFEVPPGFTSKANRFFCSRLFPSQNDPKQEIELLLSIASNCNERDGKTIETLAKEFERLGTLLAEARSRILALTKS